MRPALLLALLLAAQPARAADKLGGPPAAVVPGRHRAAAPTPAQAPAPLTRPMALRAATWTGSHRGENGGA